ncbi:hypothetical protein N9Y91_06890 [Alphaproteobacteria bacterium]|jgi:hypothetical protein|nr:hypothetical protein [Alphaproteobacteria bacterium]
MALSKILPASQEQFAGARNLIINGAMQVAQRGTQTGVRESYGVDRFKVAGDGAQIFTYSQSTTVPSGQGFSYSAKLDVTTADTSIAAGQYQLLQYIFEGQDLQHLKYGTSGAESITLQFWVRSPKTGTHIVELNHQDAAYFNSQAYTIASANTWQKVTLTFSGYQTTAITNDNTYGFSIAWWLMSGSTYSGGTLASNTWQNTAANRAAGQVNVVDSTSNEFYITGVQLEVGETATPFEHRSYGDELARCQRYYAKVSGLNIHGKQYNSSTWLGDPQYPVTMRATPSVTTTGGQYSSIQVGTSTDKFYFSRTSESCYINDWAADAEL